MKIKSMPFKEEKILLTYKLSKELDINIDRRISKIGYQIKMLN